MRSQSLALLLTALSSALVSRAQSCTLGQDVDKGAFLKLHNQAREMCGNVPALSWDDSLACASQNYANNCVWKHSGRSGVGENLAAGYGNNYGIEVAVQQWYGEIFDYKDGMGFTEATGHATQMVWKDTTAVGCGVARCRASQLGLGSSNAISLYVVCQYSPPGNVVGLPDGFSSQVFPPSSKTQVSLASPGGTSTGSGTPVNTGGDSTVNTDDSPSGSSGTNTGTTSGGSTGSSSGSTGSDSTKGSTRKIKYVGKSGRETYKTSSLSKLMKWVRKMLKKGRKVRWSWSWTTSSDSNNKKRDVGTQETSSKEAPLERRSMKGTPTFSISQAHHRRLNKMWRSKNRI